MGPAQPCSANGMGRQQLHVTANHAEPTLDLGLGGDSRILRMTAAFRKRVVTFRAIRGTDPGEAPDEWASATIRCRV
jgi:hypothetical protein